MSVSRPLQQGFWAKTVATALNLFSILRNSFFEARQARATLETELFRGRYHLSSKNDDDLPIVH